MQESPVLASRVQQEVQCWAPRRPEVSQTATQRAPGIFVCGGATQERSIQANTIINERYAKCFTSFDMCCHASWTLSCMQVIVADCISKPGRPRQLLPHSPSSQEQRHCGSPEMIFGIFSPSHSYSCLDNLEVSFNSPIVASYWNSGSPAISRGLLDAADWR